MQNYFHKCTQQCCVIVCSAVSAPCSLTQPPCDCVIWHYNLPFGIMLLWGLEMNERRKSTTSPLNNSFSHVRDTFTRATRRWPLQVFRPNATPVPLYWKQPLLFFSLSAAAAAVTWRCGPSFRLCINCGGMRSTNREGRGKNPDREALLLACKSWLSLK